MRGLKVALIILGFGCVHAGGDARQNCQNSLQTVSITL